MRKLISYAIGCIALFFSSAGPIAAERDSGERPAGIFGGRKVGEASNEMHFIRFVRAGGGAVARSAERA